MNVAFTPSLGIKWDSIPTEILEHKLRVTLMTFDGGSHRSTAVSVELTVQLAACEQLQFLAAACRLCVQIDLNQLLIEVNWDPYFQNVFSDPRRPEP